MTALKPPRFAFVATIVFHFKLITMKTGYCCGRWNRADSARRKKPAAPSVIMDSSKARLWWAAAKRLLRPRRPERDLPRLAR
jgi:hypothetical protein